VKWDGYRALLVNDDSRPRLISRNLKNLTGDYAHIAAAAPRVSAQPFNLDGEIVALGVDHFPSGVVVYFPSGASR
jgi:ATP-dependent DNA ligase